MEDTIQNTNDILHIESFKQINDWIDVKNSARTTIKMDSSEKEPTDSWKYKILMAEHSPIRQLSFRWKWVNLKYWVSVHFVRHKFGIEHFVSTQRSDRTGETRDNKPQDSLVNHECIANASEVMFISRRRLCHQASPETTEAWKMVLAQVEKVNKPLYNCCVPECIYRGFCPEFKSCGYASTERFKQDLHDYRKLIDS